MKLNQLLIENVLTQHDQKTKHQKRKNKYLIER
jgi:hypothetical protein